ncbi:MAG: ABC transporter substrate-binding protein [Bifidobacteriaceae bacterium]|jgi:NitT/TauT family transport system substrate-binding protein|nr:ABC transporter substrate-binding protein [Bifidobacteriaceae bacterium]
MRSFKSTLVAASAVAALLALTACGSSKDDAPSSQGSGSQEAGGGGGGGTGDGGGELTTVTVASSRLSHLAAIVLGDEQGIFAKHGLELSLDLDSADLAGIPAVAAGRVNFGNGETVSLLAAASEGIEVVAVLPASASTGVRGEDYGALLVSGDSPIQSPRELEGKTVSSNSLTNIASLAVREAVRADGGDPSKLNLVEVNFPDVPTALENGTIDAAWVIEPFKSAAIAGGARAIGWGFEDIADEVTVSTWITSAKFAEEHADVVSAFKAAAQESYQYARDHEDQAKAVIPTITSITPEVANTVVLTSWKDEVTVAELQRVLDAAKDFGLVTKEPDLEALIFKG